MLGISRVTFSLVVPVGTLARAPVTVERQLLGPQINGGGITFPPGCAGLVGVRLFNRSVPVCPADYSWLIADGATIAIPGGFILDGPPFVLRGECYNLDDTYPHTIYFGVDVNGKVVP